MHAGRVLVYAMAAFFIFCGLASMSRDGMVGLTFIGVGAFLAIKIAGRDDTEQ